jgi:hypothetical protein
MKASKRENILTIAEGNMVVMPVIYGIDKSFKQSDDLFQYCVRRGIVGSSFVRLCEDSKFLPMRVGNAILKRLLNERNRPLTSQDLH